MRDDRQQNTTVSLVGSGLTRAGDASAASAQAESEEQKDPGLQPLERPVATGRLIADVHPDAVAGKAPNWGASLLMFSGLRQVCWLAR
jgi:hypothetical protein